MFENNKALNRKGFNMSAGKKIKSANTNMATQSNKLIEASYKMSVPAKRVMLMLLGQIHPGQQDVSGRVRIEASDYAEKTGVALNHAYADIKNGCRELMRTIIKTKDTVRKTTSECVVVHWMEYHENEGWLEATFTPWIAPFIHKLRDTGYKTICINEAVKFKRFHTIRLYELLMQWEFSGKRHITIDDLRKTFQIEKKQYPRFSDLKRWVIEPSILEIKEKTYRKIEYEIKKTGRQISSITFNFDAKVKGSKSAQCPNTLDMII